MEEHEVYSAAGQDAFHRLAAAFYRQVPLDDVLGPMYPPGELAEAEQRLRDFLIYRFGGPPLYIEQRGHPRLRARHFPFAITPVARDRWMLLMSRALDEVRLPPEPGRILREFFGAMSTFLINRPSP